MADISEIKNILDEEDITTQPSIHILLRGDLSHRFKSLANELDTTNTKLARIVIDEFLKKYGY